MDEMEISRTPAYKKAFNEYLRRGTPIEWSLNQAAQRGELSLKAALPERPTTHYIWRTRGDNKVRAAHAANNGKVFAWDNPPPTGHPGEDYGCRCTAEPYVPRVNEYLKQAVTSIVDEGLHRWEWYEFLWHFYLGEGRQIRLSDVGHLQTIIDRARQRKVEQVFERLERQILRQARTMGSGQFTGDSSNTYDFSTVSFIHEDSKVNTNYAGFVQRDGNALLIEVKIDYFFEDEFTDPVGIRERNIGTSDPSKVPPGVPLEGELGGTRYRIYDSWSTELDAVVDIDPDKSGYK